MTAATKTKTKKARKVSTARCRCFTDPDAGRFLPATGTCPVHKESFTRFGFLGVLAPSSDSNPGSRRP
jgi:hypothetical protein